MISKPMVWPDNHQWDSYDADRQRSYSARKLGDATRRAHRDEGPPSVDLTLNERHGLRLLGMAYGVAITTAAGPV